MDSTGAQKVYASVKSYSQRGRLLPKSVLQTLVESCDLDEFVTRIKNIEYADCYTEKIEMDTKILNRTIWISTVLAMIFTLPALGIFLGIYYFTGNLIVGVILGFGMHFVTLVFSGRISSGF